MNFSAWCRAFRTSKTPATPYQISARGGTICAFQCTSIYNDSYYGQWLVLNVPANKDNHRIVWHTPFSKRVPDHFKWFATCVVLCPDEWRSISWIRKEVELRCWKTHIVDSAVNYIKSLLQTVDLYLDQRLRPQQLGDLILTRPELSPDQREAFSLGVHSLFLVLRVRAKHT